MLNKVFIDTQYVQQLTQLHFYQDMKMIVLGSISYVRKVKFFFVYIVIKGRVRRTVHATFFFEL